MGSKRVDRSHLLARAALVGVALSVVLVALSQALGVDSYALPLVLGAAFTAKVHLSSTYAAVRGMAWVIAWMFGAALLGGLVCTWGSSELVIVATVGLVGGYAGVLGARGALISVLAMEVYTVFAGLEISPSTAAKFAALLAGGGVIYLLVVTVPVPFHTPQGVVDRAEHPGPWLHRLDLRNPLCTPFGRHAMRLSITLVVGTAISHQVGWEHAYWIPMTIVLVSKPDSNGTATRIVERILGTLLGVGIAVLLFVVAGDGPVMVSLYAGVGVFLTLTFTRANYALSVTGITIVLMTLLILVGDPIVATDASRVVSTVIGGVITITATLTLWRRQPAGFS